ncbi:MAG TPA: pyridoxamine 5'-phosphate oxidase [Treponema sp.]|nr:MAG: hypothetical protein A2Y36_10845 [Treponema sp. GWA1_62_8]OHE63957.1 MAG: hypothetical protein A2001_02000 [Treponema sp. GWC1_61_84]OHE76717.1 MAG: hypothetical protein A2413_20310 [Treponema sp. RIFOXYC1_FULL_61_9]HCM25280.1 pyridoxamine 5'-phosphate oxidase [Treponema sp.]
MDQRDSLGRLERLVEASKVGILTTVDADGFPRSRWMTPAILRGRSGTIYAVTAPDSAKCAHIRKSARVEWFLQSRILDEVISVIGTASLIDNPQAKAEVLESIGPNLQIFWRTNPDARNLVVVETVLEEISVFYPMENRRERFELESGDGAR